MTSPPTAAMRMNRIPLHGARAVIDQVDDALVLLLALRRRMVRVAAACKRETGLPMRDREREARVRERTRGLARWVELPAPTARQLCDLLIEDACSLQGVGGAEAPAEHSHQPVAGASGPMDASMPIADSFARHRATWLRALPPPRRLAPLLRLLPPSLSSTLFAAAMTRALAQPLAAGALEFLRDRRLGIAVTDLGLGWVVELRDQHLYVCEPGASAEATVSGSATDLLLLASRREDADTLFFQRRLQLTGDTELGLTARNVLDRLPWETVPLALRIAIHRAALLAQAARAAHRGEEKR